MSTPLLLVPLWTRRWWLYAPIGLWFAVNPVMTPKAHDTSSFATRAILGEEAWTRDPTSEPRVLALSGVASATLVGAMVASYRQSKTAAVAGTGIFMALTLWQWKLWGDRFTREATSIRMPSVTGTRTRRAASADGRSAERSLRHGRMRRSDSGMTVRSPHSTRHSRDTS
jgi:hypothetical protein